MSRNENYLAGYMLTLDPAMHPFQRESYQNLSSCEATRVLRRPTTGLAANANSSRDKLAWHCAGMVAETGDATARFLRSVAAGDVDPRPDEEAAAAAGAQRMAVLSPPKKQACCQASADLVRPKCMGRPH